MAVKEFKVEFRGTVSISFDPANYPHRDTSTPEKLEQLASDLFYDEAQLRNRPFVDGSCEMYDALLDYSESI